MKLNPIRATIEYLRRCQAARRAGHSVSYTTDPVWLLDMAINRRAGWLDDPTHSRGSCRPAGGRYPKKAEGQEYGHLRLLARSINTPRLIVRGRELGEWRKLILSRIPERIFREERGIW